MPVFDTYSSVRRLKETGLPEEQAAGVVGEQLQLLAESISTKDEVQVLSHRMDGFDQRMDSLEQRLNIVVDRISILGDQLRAEQKASEARLIQYMVGLNLATVGAIAALFKLLG